MRCSVCGGEVFWVGPLSNLTHTSCRQCGAVNSQIQNEIAEEYRGIWTCCGGIELQEDEKCPVCGDEF